MKDIELTAEPDETPFHRNEADDLAALADLYGAEIARETGQSPERFTVRDEGSAAWVVGKILAIEAEEDRRKAQHAKRMAELKADRERLERRFGADLEAWGREEKARRRRQEVTLDTGTIAYRKTNRRVEIADPTDALTTAKAVCPEAVVEKLNAATFLQYARDRFKETGEVLPGTLYAEERESFSIRANKPTAPTDEQ